MEQQFHAWSFFSGMLSGMIIRYTDIIPLLGGFLAGLTVAKMPELLTLNDLPVRAKEYIKAFRDA